MTKSKALVTIIACNILSALAIAVGAYLMIHYTEWGHLSRDMGVLTPPQLARRYGDPASILSKGALIHQWVAGPLLAFAVGMIAGSILRKADWRISTLSIISVVFCLSLPTDLLDTSSTILYVAVGWAGMKISSHNKSSRFQSSKPASTLNTATH